MNARQQSRGRRRRGSESSQRSARTPACARVEVPAKSDEGSRRDSSHDLSSNELCAGDEQSAEDEHIPFPDGASALLHGMGKQAAGGM